jgi:DNA-binding transcriptional MerR regulator
MKRSASYQRIAGGHADEGVRARTSLRGLLEDREIDEIERASPDGLTSRQIVDVFETRGIRFSEATLRKYVQLGLLPRSVRVGRKGKHRGSCGLYPSHVVRRVNVVKGMMAEDRTIEEIQRSFARFKDDIESVEKNLRELISGFEREAKAPNVAADGRRELEREIIEAKRAAGELVRRIASVERRISAHVDPVGGGSSAGGGSDLY